MPSSCKWFPHDLLQLMQRERARSLPGIVARPRHQRLLLIELILNLANQLFEDILQRHHAQRAAVFIHDNRQVQLALQE